MVSISVSLHAALLPFANLHSHRQAAPVAAQQVATDGLAHFGQALRQRGISAEAAAIIADAHAASTKRHYNSAWRRWLRWCGQRPVDPIRPSEADLLNYLASYFGTGRRRAATSLLAEKSGILALIDVDNATPLRTSPLIQRFMKGAFRQNPAKPKYTDTWDPSVVLSYLRDNLADNDTIDVAQLAKKAAVLLGLARPSRAAELASIDARSLSHDADGLHVALLKPHKAQRKGPLAAFVVRHGDNIATCPVKAIHSYLRRTAYARPRIDHLFITHAGPMRPASATTLRRWIADIMRSAGVPDRFAPHSLRGAVASAQLRAGRPLHEILQAGLWSKNSTACKRFYLRELAQRDKNAAASAAPGA